MSVMEEKEDKLHFYLYMCWSCEKTVESQAFLDTIEESADKLWLHTNELAGNA